MSDLFLITDEKALVFNGSEVRKIEVHFQTHKDITWNELDDINKLDEVLKRVSPTRKVKFTED